MLLHYVLHIPEPRSKPYLSLTCVTEIMQPDSGCIHNYRLTVIRLSSGDLVNSSNKSELISVYMM